MPNVNYRNLLGVPFAENGPPDGHNCWTLVREVASRAGIEYPHRDFVYDLAVRHSVVNETIDRCLVRLDKPYPYCIVAFCMRPQLVTHMGIVLEDLVHFLHVMRKRSVCCERLDRPQWRKKIEGYYGLNDYKS